MKIYELNNKEIRNFIREFGKCTYGKIVFLLAYTFPFIFSIFTCTYGIITNEINILFLFIILGTFILGSIYYYNELVKFINKK